VPGGHHKSSKEQEGLGPFGDQIQFTISGEKTSSNIDETQYIWTHGGSKVKAFETFEFLQVQRSCKLRRRSDNNHWINCKGTDLGRLNPHPDTQEVT
jgi:hypothetical protein